MMKPYITSLDEIPQGAKIAIYGAGSAGVKFKSDMDLSRRDIQLHCFVDSFKSGMIEHTEIVNANAMDYSSVDLVVICSQKFQQIYEWLRSRGVTNLTVHNPSLNDVYLSATQSMDGGKNAFAFATEGASVMEQRVTPCHLHFPFVQYTGDVFPCCKRRGQADFKIGNIDDASFLDAFLSFDTKCSCESAVLRPIGPSDALGVDVLNVELSLACQADCAMCCVNAPEWKGHYDGYSGLSTLIDVLGVKSVLVQGGEVLVQKESLEWIRRTKSSRPDITFSIVSNGNVPLSMVPLVESLFDHITISVVGFAEGTYRRIMGLERDRMCAFAEKLLVDNTTGVTMKYLCTPLSLPEADAFLSWAIPLVPRDICLSDANCIRYVNLDTDDRYWLKIIRRTEKDVKKVLRDHAALLAANRTRIFVETPIRVIFNLDRPFLEEAGLEGVLS